jgi:hypothetical protein
MKIVSKAILISIGVLASVVTAKESEFSVQTRADRTILTIGDRFHYTLTLKYSPDLQLDSLNFQEILGGFEIRDSLLTIKTGKKQIVTTYEFTLVPWLTGEFEIPPVAISYQDKEGNQKTVFSEPVKIKVESVLGEVTETTDVKGLKAQLSLGKGWWFYVAMILGLIVLGAALWLYWLKNRRKKIVQPERMRLPWELALEELFNLKEKQCSGGLSFREYYFQLSEILRGYLERRFSIPLLESTTEEIRLILERDFLQPDSKTVLLRFFEQSDLIKFAKVVPENQQLDHDWQLAYQIVEQTIPRPEPVQTGETAKV